MVKAAVVGAGAWGTALAIHLARTESTVALWTWDEQHAAQMRADRENKAFFAGFSLPSAVTPTADLAEALGDASLVIFVVPSHGLRGTAVRAREYLAEGALVVTATKGIEDGTLMLMTEVLRDVLGSKHAHRIVAISGPSFAQEVAMGHPTNVVAACSEEASCVELQLRLGSERFRVYSSDDPVGVEMGGALKNVIAIAAGACEGLGFGHNSGAALITRGLAEVTRLAVAKGGNPLTLAGLAGMGDLVLTCTGSLSRNRVVGFELGRGRLLQDILDKLGHVAEGVATARSAVKLAEQVGVELPISAEVHAVLYEGKSPQDAVRDVLARPLRRERD